ncbi:MAG: amidohydrolase [Clostridia bacterium]|nr:amidohydrolase [Clostridia bacterium]
MTYLDLPIFKVSSSGISSLEQDLIRLRREIHRHPELGWEVDRTAALVCRELDAYGVPYARDRYGRNTVVATLGPEDAPFTIGLRADMDALPILEADRGQPYRSECDGVMHACGHDAHTAMMLGVARVLGSVRESLRCRVKLIFQPCEESRPSGAKTMCEHGIMEDIDCILMCHVNCNDPAGAPSCCSGITNATSTRFRIITHGESVHVASPHRGKDALLMAVRIYEGIQTMLSREQDPFDPCVIGVCTMHAGDTISTNADRCEMQGSIRCFKDETLAWVQGRLEALCRHVCEDLGGTCDVEIAGDPLPVARNDERLYRAFLSSSALVVGHGGVLPLLPSPGGEDFAFYEQHRPGLLFGLGCRNDEKGFNRPAHTKDWDIDESALITGVKLFVQFVLAHMDGIEGLT